MKKTLIISIGFLLLITILCLTIQAQVNITTNIHFTVGNETYLVNDTTRNFSQIIISDNYIVFNTSGFNITSSNSITIFIDYINSSITTASKDDFVLEFCADTSSGTVTFTINGFKNNQQYHILRNNTKINTVTTNSSGEMTFTNSVWSKKSFEIYEESYTVIDTDTFGGEVDVTTVPPLPGDTPPTIENETITNMSYLNELALNWTVDIWDTQGDINSWDINCSDGSSIYGSVGNQTIGLDLTTLSYFSQYFIYVNCSDPNNNTFQSYWFYTKNSTTFINNASNASFPVPTNHSTGISPQPICNATVIDQDGNSSTCDFYTSPDNSSWTWVQTNTTVLNESIQFNYTIATGFNTKYYWNITVNDGLDNVSFFFDFTTHIESVPPLAKDTPPIFSNPNPANESTGQPINLIWNITIHDNDSTFNYTIHTSNGDSTADNNTANGSKTIGLGGLSYSTQYTVWVNATDTVNTSNVTRASYVFTTQAETIANITISNIYPSNNSNNIPLQPYIYALFNSTDEDTLNITWYHNNRVLGTEISVNNGTYNELMLNATSRAISYTWIVKVNDGSGNWLNNSYNFRTEGYDNNMGYIPTSNTIAYLGIFGIIAFALVLMLIFFKKRKEKEE